MIHQELLVVLVVVHQEPTLKDHQMVVRAQVDMVVMVVVLLIRVPVMAAVEAAAKLVLAQMVVHKRVMVETVLRFLRDSELLVLQLP
tara:strand:- start:104 stop:364 length:261 start_codon:yes stop_codon:yes gene_type:complete